MDEPLVVLPTGLAQRTPLEATGKISITTSMKIQIFDSFNDIGVTLLRECPSSVADLRETESSISK